MIDIVNSLQHYQPVLWNVDNSGLLESKRSVIQHDNEANKIAQQSATELMGAINKLDIHEDYRHVKHELYNELDGVINSTLQNYNGSLRYAINDLMGFSRDILASHRITGLIETNQQYKTWKAGIEARDDISDDIKEMIISENPYSFELTYKKNASGEEIVDAYGNKEANGYKDWVPTTHPVEQMDYNRLNTIALQYINPHISGSSSITYLDKDGKAVPLSSESQIMYYKTSTEDIHEITKENVIKALKTAYNSDPKVRASLEQDYRLAVWQYNNNKYSPSGSTLWSYKKSDGTFNTFDSYVNNIFNSIADTYSYRNVVNRSHLSGGSSSSNGGGDGEVVQREEVDVVTGYTVEAPETPAEVVDAQKAAQQQYNANGKSF
jgi:hypothetical protein